MSFRPSVSLPLSLLSLSLASIVSAQSASLSPAAQAAQAGASQILSPSFAGFGLEPSNLYSFTGGSRNNHFTSNLLNTLTQYSGAPPAFRIGGNTGDYMIYDESYNGYHLRENANSQGAGAITSDSSYFGPTYFEVIDRCFPAGTPITYQLNMAWDGDGYIEGVVRQAQAAVDRFTNVELRSFEMGNEPDLWLQNGFRTGSWGGQVYTQQWLERVAAVYSRVLQPAGIRSNFFEPPATASTMGTTFEINMLVEYGITEPSNDAPNGYVNAWNQHDYFYFISVTPYPITLDHLQVLRNTENQFKYWESQVAQALGTGLLYHLREMSSVGPIGQEGVSDTFGASLWTLNFFLYTATLNISSVQMHMTDNSFASPWQPDRRYDRDPHVRPNYYAYAAMAQLIGSGNGTAQVARLAMPGLPPDYGDSVRCYSVYRDGSLSAVVMINSKPANASAPAKASLTLDLTLPSSLAGETLYLSYLTAPGGDSQSGTTWNGLSYEESNDGTPTAVADSIQTVQVSSDGSARVSVRDSEALVANIGFRLGERAVLAPNGSTTTSSASSRTTRSSAAGGAESTRNVAVLTAAATTTVALLGSATPEAAEAATTSRPSKASAKSEGRRVVLAIGAVLAGVVMAGIIW
ncbi:hypothetical protein W97_00427 [Coniosporium apollinis CBS 100218]|uniref:Beta-glucuronidase C-terminal domain-containing protein n=1 Tax=Coniosporium apollinis (strain CBS 100218) TaxID=1168221 RepID=R7YHE2_CONA1|nr:uncharacterized protein W97_00427 [Coniosporium apollinis CBS 100218]EON61214.1 hypothetical protein W97_00427 [Coniosporium apollinis CBS 100218]